MKSLLQKIVLGLLVLPTLGSQGCSFLAYQPSQRLFFPPQQFNLEPERIRFKAKDGRSLFGWYFPPKLDAGKNTDSLGTLVQFHGNGENMSSHYLSLAWIVEHGYGLFTFDYGGYGRSEGAPSQERTHLDALAAIDWAHEIHSRDSPDGLFILYGQSLGGVIAMRALQDSHHKKHVDLIVMDSTFLDYKDVAQNILAKLWFTWPFSPLGQLIISNEYGADMANKKNTIPLLVIHDKNDPQISYHFGEEIYKNSKAPRFFWKPKNGFHVGVFALKNKKWRKKFLGFLSNRKQASLGLFD